jgi:hypothetical protein
MDLASRSDGAPSHVCSSCDQSFAGTGPLNFHQRSCKKTKRRLQGALVRAKELWEARKRSKRHPLGETQVVDGSPSDPPTQIPKPTFKLATAATPGSSATSLGMAEAQTPPLPAITTGIQVVSTQSNVVCGGAQAAGADH